MTTTEPAPTYRAVLADTGNRTWYTAAALVRAPVVMAPLALVLLGHATSSFAAGGLLAAAHALGEAAGAPLMGRRFDTRPFVGQLRLALLLEAAAFAALAALASSAPIPVLAVLAALAGAAAAGAPGGLRAQLAATAAPHLRRTALSLESSLNQSVWAFGPPLVSLLYVQVSAVGAVVVLAVLSGLPALFASRIPHRSLPEPGLGDAPAENPVKVLRLMWPTAVLSAGIMFLVGTVDVVLPARLTDIGSSEALAGPVLTAFAVASVLSGLVYGGRRWPGSAQTQSLVLLLTMAAVLTLPAWTGTPWSYAAAFAVAGLLYSPLLIIRNLTLQEQLPERVWATGFSLLYAAAGAGYGVASLLSAAALKFTDSSVAIMLCTTLTAALGVISLLAEKRRRARA
ncbi:MFS transporter [Streptomyces sp. NPDC015492]|uniref:MFS transporter n=1 Tax=Streptomyces sp. NPDC015492 TaxID=3364958 RepID=UPI0036FE74D0